MSIGVRRREFSAALGGLAAWPLPAVPHTSQLHVVERFKLIEDGKILQANFTIDDPGAFNAPWSGVVTYRHAPSAQRVVEDRCSENNINVLGDHNIIPVATKPDF
jgi:hypothetical protein